MVFFYGKNVICVKNFGRGCFDYILCKKIVISYFNDLGEIII